MFHVLVAQVGRYLGLREVRAAEDGKVRGGEDLGNGGEVGDGHRAAVESGDSHGTRGFQG
jgi:hypothetical protein